LPEKWTTTKVFKAVVIATMLFSVPDFLSSLGLSGMKDLNQYIPLSSIQMGWIIPALFTLVVANLFAYFKGENNK
jgi:LIVCS family branched-chain amino acid:cation transporter